MTTTTETTAREQFIEDYLMVSLNDEPSYLYLKEQVDTLEVCELATILEDEFEEMVAEMTDPMPENARLMVRQMLMNQGMDTWHALARELKERLQD